MSLPSLNIRYNAPVTLTFSLVCVGVFILCEIIPGLRYNVFCLTGSFSLANPMDYLRLVTYTFGHADANHLVGNMSIFLLIAPIMEEKYGSRDIAGMMIATAIITAVFQILLFSTGLLGASGLVFMFIVLVSFADARKGSIPLTFILVLIFFVGKEVMNSVKNDGVSQYAHIAGGIIGGIFGFMAENRRNSNKEV